MNFYLKLKSEINQFLASRLILERECVFGRNKSVLLSHEIICCENNHKSRKSDRDAGKITFL